MSNEQGPISTAAKEAAAKYFATIQDEIVAAAQLKAYQMAQKQFQEAFDHQLGKLHSAATLAAYQNAYTDALANASNFIPKQLVPPPEVPALVADTAVAAPATEDEAAADAVSN